jgi:hypothetical protein
MRLLISLDQSWRSNWGGVRERKVPLLVEDEERSRAQLMAIESPCVSNLMLESPWGCLDLYRLR